MVVISSIVAVIDNSKFLNIVAEKQFATPKLKSAWSSTGNLRLSNLFQCPIGDRHLKRGQTPETSGVKVGTDTQNTSLVSVSHLPQVIQTYHLEVGTDANNRGWNAKKPFGT